MIKILPNIEQLGWYDFEELDSGKSSMICIKSFFPREKIGLYYKTLKQSEELLDKVDACFYQTAMLSKSGFTKYINNSLNIETVLKNIDHLCGHDFFRQIDNKLQQSLKHEIKRLNLDTIGILSKIAIHHWENMMIPPHHDKISEEAPTSLKARQCESQFAINIYMNQEFTGGDLVVYKSQLEQNIITDYLAGKISKKEMGLNEGMHLSPQCGDLVIISTKYIHEVTPIYGSRMSTSFFLGRFKNDPHLRIWA